MTPSDIISNKTKKYAIDEPIITIHVFKDSQKRVSLLHKKEGLQSFT